jgi:pyruvate/2-oxoglutarate dehydrogenase complex dihydrolipoamide dehydrogenase (E3) component
MRQIVHSTFKIQHAANIYGTLRRNRHWRRPGRNSPLAKKLAESGLKTALIEKRWVGGTCVNDGCSPTKAMVASAKAAWSVEHNKKLGVVSEKVTIDFETIIKRKNDIVKSMRGNVEKGIKKTENLDLYYGSASFSGAKELTS